MQVPPPPASKVRYALAPKPDHRSRLRPCAEPHPFRAVEGLDLELGPQSGLHHRHLNHSEQVLAPALEHRDRKSTRLNSSHVKISYAVFCLKKKKKKKTIVYIIKKKKNKIINISNKEKS